MNAFNHYLKILFIAGIFISCNKDKDSSQQENPCTNRRNPDSISRVETDIREGNVFKCDYMNQEKPDSIPIKFMPGIISTRVDESCFEISPSGKEIVFNREYNIYLINQDEKDIWTQPVLFLKSGGENSFSKDGSIIYFNS